MLIVLSGLPGVGKTTVARELARSLAAVYLRIDSIEQALRGSGVVVEGEGYAVAHAVAADNLRTGQTVVADCVNPWPLTRDEWRAVGERIGVPVVEVEVVCSDRADHRRRVESRVARRRKAAYSEPTRRGIFNQSLSAPDGGSAGRAKLSSC